MLKDRVLFTGTSSISHPVLDRLFGGPLDASTARKSRSDAILHVVDARLGTSDLADARASLEAGVPVLIVSPQEGQLEALAGSIGIVPRTPMQAVFITPSRNKNEKNRFEATALADSPQSVHSPARSQELPALEGEDRKDRAAHAAGCRCAKRAAQSSDDAVANFAAHVESRLTRGYSPDVVSIPDGLKYFQETWNVVGPFTTDRCNDDGDCFANGEGSVTVSYVIWGFLNQTASSNSQYLIVEGTYNVYPGSLARNDEEARGYVNVFHKSSVGPTSGGFAPVGHIPTNGTNSWNENLTINISYKDPLGGYQIYPFESDVNQTIDSFSVQNVSSGTNLGSNWFINSPVNGTDIGGTWDDAFTFWGHVEPFPSAATGTLTVKETSAWQTSTIQTGNVTVALKFNWDEDIWFSTACGPLICYRLHEMGLGWSWELSFVVNFSSIKP